ncbi:MAG: hypothetical protein ACYDH1_18740 [Anaerolineaceae bacterium]
MKNDKLKENEVEKILRTFLTEKGWKLTNLPKSVGCHGCDITAWHPKWRKVLLVEVKGNGKAEHQTKHNSFYTLLGQILSRMDIEGNNPKKARIYAIAIPVEWEDVFRNKIKKMTFGWKLLKLKIFLVSEKKVEERGYNYFLSKKI